MKNRVKTKILIRIEKSKGERYIDPKNIFKKLGVVGFIRIQENEFEKIDIRKKFFAHFNLEQTGHKVGKKYALVRTLRHGSYGANVKTEEPPLLSLDKIYIAKCVQVENFISYSSLNLKYFEHSLKEIKDPKSLQKAIIDRYKESRKDLTQREIVNKGVGFTLLEFIKTDNSTNLDSLF